MHFLATTCQAIPSQSLSRVLIHIRLYYVIYSEILSTQPYFDWQWLVVNPLCRWPKPPNQAELGEFEISFKDQVNRRRTLRRERKKKVEKGEIRGREIY